MKLTPEDWIRLDDYLLGRCRPEERQVVDKLVETDPDWQAAYAKLKSLAQGMRFHGLQEWMKEMQAQEKNDLQLGDLEDESALIVNQGAGRHDKTPIMTNETPNRDALRYHGLMQVARQLQQIELQGHLTDQKIPSLSRRWQWMAGIAATIVLLLVVWPWIRPQTAGEKIFAEMFVAPELASFQVRGESPESTLDPLQRQAYGAYVTENYGRALRFFRMAGPQDDPEYQLIYGVTLLQKDKSRQALKIFQEGIHKWPDAFDWNRYIGFALLKDNRIEEAKKYLNLD